MATYGDAQRVIDTVCGHAALHGYTLLFAHEFNRRAMALQNALAFQQGVKWDEESLNMLLVVDATTLLGEKAEEIFRELCKWLVDQGFSLEKSA